MAMYARISTFEGSTARFEEAAEFIRAFVIPASRQVPGFAGMISLVDRGSGRSMGITLWTSREAMDDSEPGAILIRERGTSSGEARLVSLDSYDVADLTLV
jgi:hypothetical protein